MRSLLRRWAAPVTAVVLTTAVLTATVATASSAAVASASPGGKTGTVQPGSTWTLTTGAFCETVVFGAKHRFSAVLSSSGGDGGGGDRGTYRRGTTFTMRWTSGASAGALFRGQLKKSIGVYGGPYSQGGTAVDGNLDPASSTGCAVVTATLTTPRSVVYGQGGTDAVTLIGTGGVAPTGSVDFWECPGPDPCQPNSPGSEDLGPITVAGSGDIATAAGGVDPTAPGDYCLADFYSGDSRYVSGFNASTDLCFTVMAATPVITTEMATTVNEFGIPNYEIATVPPVPGGNFPTGTVAFYQCGPEETAESCTTTTGSELGSPVPIPTPGPNDDQPSQVTSPLFSPTTAGVYCFLTVYSGDANYVSVSDGSTTQCFTETMATPQVAAARQGGNGRTRLVTIDGRGSK